MIGQIDLRQPTAFTPLRLDAFLDRATRYETWRTPFDPSLMRLARLAAGANGAALAVWLSYPVVLSLAHGGFFLVGGGFVQGAFLLQLPFVVLALISLVAFGAAYSQTDSLAAGTPAWHYALFGIVAVGALELFALGLVALVIAVNVVIWVVLAILFVMFLLAALAVAAAASD